MAKSIQDIRDRAQKVLEKICGDDSLFVERILEQFDRDNGITPQVLPKSPQKLSAVSTKQVKSRGRSRTTRSSGTSAS